MPGRTAQRGILRLSGPVLDGQAGDLAKCPVIRHKHHVSSNRVTRDQHVERSEDTSEALHIRPQVAIAFRDHVVPREYVDTP
jgi:hypothetical protein